MLPNKRDALKMANMVPLDQVLSKCFIKFLKYSVSYILRIKYLRIKYFIKSCSL